jgi:hypothetical protein
MLDPDGQNGLTAVVVSGEGGIGKTALAVAAAHAAQKRGWLSGTLFVNLRGQDTDPATADQVAIACQRLTKRAGSANSSSAPPPKSAEGLAAVSPATDNRSPWPAPTVTPERTRRTRSSSRAR